jgi:hypothetical protein
MLETLRSSGLVQCLCSKIGMQMSLKADSALMLCFLHPS